mgnify:CR=1 FL=1
MKKLLLLLLFSLFVFFSCSDSNTENEGYSLLSKELEDSVYVENGTMESDGNTYNWQNYYTFDFETYAYIQNGVTDWPARSECYSTHWVRDGALIVDSGNSLSYVKNTTTYSMTKISINVLKIQIQSLSSNISFEIVKSDFATFEDAKRGKRSSNTCD